MLSKVLVSLAFDHISCVRGSASNMTPSSATPCPNNQRVRIHISFYQSIVCFHYIYCFSYYSLSSVCLFLSTILYHQQQRRHVLYQDHCHHGNVVLLSKIPKTFKWLAFRVLLMLLKAAPGRNVSSTTVQQHISSSSSSSGTRTNWTPATTRTPRQLLTMMSGGSATTIPAYQTSPAATRPCQTPSCAVAEGSARKERQHYHPATQQYY